MTNYEAIKELEEEVHKAIRIMFKKAFKHTPEYINGIIVYDGERYQLTETIVSLFDDTTKEILRKQMIDVAEREQRQLQVITEIIPKLTEKDKDDKK